MIFKQQVSRGNNGVPSPGAGLPRPSCDHGPSSWSPGRLWIPGHQVSAPLPPAEIDRSGLWGWLCFSFLSGEIAKLANNQTSNLGGAKFWSSLVSNLIQQCFWQVIGQAMTLTQQKKAGHLTSWLGMNASPSSRVMQTEVQYYCRRPLGECLNKRD